MGDIFDQIEEQSQPQQPIGDIFDHIEAQANSVPVLKRPPQEQQVPSFVPTGMGAPMDFRGWAGAVKSVTHPIMQGLEQFAAPGFRALLTPKDMFGIPTGAPPVINVQPGEPMMSKEVADVLLNPRGSVMGLLGQKIPSLQGFTDSLSEQVRGMTTPGMVATLPLAATKLPVLANATKAFFGADIGSSAPDIFDKIEATFSNPNSTPQQKGGAVAEGVVPALMLGHMAFGGHGAKEEAPVKPPIIPDIPQPINLDLASIDGQTKPISPATAGVPQTGTGLESNSSSSSSLPSVVDLQKQQFAEMVVKFKAEKDPAKKMELWGQMNDIQNQNGGMAPGKVRGVTVAPKVAAAVPESVTPVVEAPKSPVIEQAVPPVIPQPKEMTYKHQPVLDSWRKDTGPNAPEIVVENDSNQHHVGDAGQKYGIQGTVRDGKIVVNLAHIDSPMELRRVLREEHNHLLLDGPDGRAAIDGAVKANLGVEEMGDLQKRYPQQPGESSEGHQQRLVNEFISQAASEKQGTFKKIVEQVKTWLASKGIGELKDAEIARAIVKTLKETGQGKGEKSLTKQALPDDRLFVTQTEKELGKVSPFGRSLSKDGTMPKESLLASMKNLVSKDEMSALDEGGLQDFLKSQGERVNTQQLKEWIKENGPQVEVKKLDAVPKEMNATEQEFYKLQHEWYDRLGSSQQSVVSQARQLYGEDRKKFLSRKLDFFADEAKDVEKSMRYLELQESPDMRKTDVSQDSATARYQMVNPKPLDKMPGAVDILVRKPQVEFKAKEYPERSPEEKAKFLERPKFEGNHFGSSDKNILGWTRGYMETLPDGKKVFLGFELQSDWAKQRQEYEAKYPEGKRPEFEYNKVANDPALSHYESLALKAAIEHARKEGATHYAMVDGETAALTEGHDRVIKIARDHDGFKLGPNDNFPSEFERLVTKPVYKGSVEGVSTQGDLVGGGKFHVDNNRIVIDKEPFIEGDKQHYDQNAPNILEKLTGSKGERVEFGEHQNVYEQGTSFPLENEATAAIRRRKDLIFRNPDGTPKTTISARMYPIDKVAERLEKGEPFQTFGTRYSLTKDPIGTKLAKERDAFADFWKRKIMQGQTIPAMKDAVDNTANILARQRVNEAYEKLRENFGLLRPKGFKENFKAEIGLQSRGELSPIQKVAMTAVVEAQGERAKIAEFRQKIAGKTTRAANVYRRALTVAEQHWDKFQDAVGAYEDQTFRQVVEENAVQIMTELRSGYVPHIQDIRDVNAILFDHSGAGAGSSGYVKPRTHATFADSIAADVKPVSLDAFDLLEHRLAAGQRRINMVKMTESLTKVLDPATQIPILRDIEQIQTTGGRTVANTPKGYSPMYIGNHSVNVHNGYKGLFEALTGTSAMQNNALRRGIMSGTSLIKHSVLLFDFYHPIRLFMYSAPLRGTHALESLKPGQLLLDYNDATLQKMANRGEIPASILPEIQRKRAIVAQGVKQGYNIGRMSDALHTEFMRSAPVLKQSVGRYNKWLFEEFQRGLMAETFVIEFERQQKNNPTMTDQQVAAMTSKDLNIRFGNMMNQSWIKNKTMQDMLRFTFLAPQWNEGLLRSELGAITQTGKMAKDLAFQRRLVAGTLVKDAGIMFAAYFIGNQFINYLTRGKPTWENDDNTPGAKISAYIPDYLGKGPGFFLNPLSLVAEISHGLIHKFEKTGDGGDALTGLLDNKLHLTGRAMKVLATGEDFRHNKLPGWERIGGAAKALIPAPIQTQMIVDAVKGKESYPGSKQQQLMSTMGVKGDIAHDSSPALNLAKRLMKQKFGNAPMTEEKQVKYEKEAEAVEQMKLGKMTLAEARQSGQVEKGRAKAVRDKVRLSSLVYTVNRLSVEDSMQVYAEATPAEKVAIRRIITGKVYRSKATSLAQKKVVLGELRKPVQ